MDQSQSFQTFSFRGTSTSRDAPNPLRPYYIPPSIGLPPSDGPPSGNAPSANRSSFPAAARELFSDIDYESYIPDRSSADSVGGGGIAEMTKRIVDQAIWNYTSVLLAQPFEVAKIVLQCYQADSSVVTGGAVAAKGMHTPSSSGVRNGVGGEPGVRLPVDGGCT
jgi:fusion and transport protein UGO1